jgi:hypothetical protein
MESVPPTEQILLCNIIPTVEPCGAICVTRLSRFDAFHSNSINPCNLSSNQEWRKTYLGKYYKHSDVRLKPQNVVREIHILCVTLQSNSE